MAVAKTDSDAGSVAMAQARHRGLRHRALLALVAAAALGPVVGWEQLIAWLLVYAGVQGLDWALSDAPLRRSRKAMLCLTVLDSVVYGALPLAAIFQGQAWATLCGALFLAGAMLGVAQRYARSRSTYIAATAPLALYVLVAAGVAGRLSGQHGVTFAAAASGAVLVVAAARLWRSLAESREAQRRMRAEAERRKREAEAAASATEAFMAAASQAMGAPIDVILARAETIERGAGDKAACANAELIAEAGRMIRTLLADLTDLSALESGRLRLEAATFDLRDLVAQATDDWIAQARRKSLFLRVDGDQALPTSVRGDSARVRQILDGLVAHAVGATDHGGVTVSIVPTRLEPGETKEFDEKDWLVRFCVSDTGPAYTPEQRAHLFGPIDAGGASEGRLSTATSLTVCRTLARRMGGDLYPAGGVDGGARLTLEVGLAEAASAPRPMLSAANQRADLRALVVDDNEMSRRAIGLMLEPFGVRLIVAASSYAALEILDSTPLDLVLIDLDMPSINGLEACRRLRAAPGVNRSTPVIACMASTEAADLDACSRAGVTACVAKPIEAPVLYETVDRALLARRAGRASAAA